MKRLLRVIALTACASAIAGCAPAPQYDLVIRHGIVYDGTGAAGVPQDLAATGARIVALGNLERARGRQEVDATGLAVAPGFINMLSHSETSLIADGRSQGDLRQGVTLEVFGESSMGPLSEQMKKDQTERQGDIKFDIAWTTLGEYLEYTLRGLRLKLDQLARRGERSLPVDREREQNVAAETAPLRIAGGGQQDPVRDRRSADVNGSPPRLHAVDRGKLLCGVEIPHDAAVLRRVPAQVAVHRAGKDDAVDEGGGCRLRGTAVRPAVATGRRRMPDLVAIRQ